MMHVHMKPPTFLGHWVRVGQFPVDHRYLKKDTTK